MTTPISNSTRGLLERLDAYIKAKPSALPAFTYALIVDDANTFIVDRTGVRANPAPKPLVQCTIRTSAAALDTLAANPGKIGGLVLTGKLRVDDIPKGLQLGRAIAEALKT